MRLIEVYYYIPANEVDYAVECGIKLSKWYDKEVYFNGDKKKCISCLLNPKDDIQKYKSSNFQCLKLQLSPNYCFAADRYLYNIGLNYPDVMWMYSKSIIPVNEYIFGSYRLPECLVTSTVIGEQVSSLDRRLDSPVLYNNSEELYINNIIENYRERYSDFNDSLLYYFYCKLAETEKIDKIEDSENRIAVFIDKENNRSYTVRIPDINRDWIGIES